MGSGRALPASPGDCLALSLRETPFHEAGRTVVAGLLPLVPEGLVLVADDEESIRVLCRVNLQVEGVEVLEARDGSEALEIAMRERPDLVLLDVMMPEIDGWEVARSLAEDPATRTIPILFMTALAGADDRRRGFDAGGVGYIVKPFDPIRLGEKVNRTLELLDNGDRDRLRREMLDGP